MNLEYFGNVSFKAALFYIFKVFERGGKAKREPFIFI
jgi:hypothetical protein